jgi:hypothetical protein
LTEIPNKKILLAATLQVSELILALRASGQDSSGPESDNKRILRHLFDEIEVGNEDNYPRSDNQ